MTRVVLASLFFFGTLRAMVWAADTEEVNDTAVRDAVSHSLPYLEKEGVVWTELRSRQTRGREPAASREGKTQAVDRTPLRN